MLDYRYGHCKIVFGVEACIIPLWLPVWQPHPRRSRSDSVLRTLVFQNSRMLANVNFQHCLQLLATNRKKLMHEDFGHRSSVTNSSFRMARLSFCAALYRLFLLGLAWSGYIDLGSTQSLAQHTSCTYTEPLFPMLTYGIWGAENSTMTLIKHFLFQALRKMHGVKTHRGCCTHTKFNIFQWSASQARKLEHAFRDWHERTSCFISFSTTGVAVRMPKNRKCYTAPGESNFTIHIVSLQVRSHTVTNVSVPLLYVCHDKPQTMMISGKVHYDYQLTWTLCTTNMCSELALHRRLASLSQWTWFCSNVV